MSNNPIRDTPYRGQIVVVDGQFVEQMQILLEAIELVLNTGKLNAYTVETVPDADESSESIIFVTDAAVGPTIAWSDGAVWKVPAASVTLS
jgi:hypothetical protein